MPSLQRNRRAVRLEQFFAESGLDKLSSYLYMLYQFLQIMGYRLVGAPCTYQWGQYGVKPKGPITYRRQLTAMLFPLVVYHLIMIVAILVTSLLAIFFLFYAHIPWLFIPLTLLPGLLLGPFFYWVLFDLWKVRRLHKS